MAEERKQGIESKEAIKLCFESLKQMATLSSGAIVLIGTFLSSGFFRAPVEFAKYLIAASFVLFSLSLAVSAIAMDFNVVVMKDIEEHRVPRKRLPLSKVPLSKVTAGAMAAALGLFSLGIFCFGLAVIVSLFRQEVIPLQ